MRGKATRVGSVLVVQTTERTLRRQGRAFRPKISSQRDRKCRETFPENRIVEDRHYPCTLSPATTPGGYEDRAGVDDTKATVDPASGRRKLSGVHRDSRDGYRPTGPGRAPPEKSEVDLRHSEQIAVRPDQTGWDRMGPDQTGSDRIRPNQARSSQTDPEPAEVEPVDRHGVPDDRGYPSVGELQPTRTRERLAELQKTDLDVAIIREWLEARVEPTRERVMPCSTEVKAYVSQWKSLIGDNSVMYRKFERPTGGVLF